MIRKQLSNVCGCYVSFLVTCNDSDIEVEMMKMKQFSDMHHKKIEILGLYCDYFFKMSG